MIPRETFFGNYLKCRKGSGRRITEHGLSLSRLNEGETPQAGELQDHVRQEYNTRFIEWCLRDAIRRHVIKRLRATAGSLHSVGIEKKVTILMADLRDFTQLADKLRPEEVRRLLNTYISRMMIVIEKYRGTIVDFYGDGILVFFDGNNVDISHRAVDAVKCAMEMQKKLNELPGENGDPHAAAMAMGVGIHTGTVSVGFIGSSTARKFGIAGSAVNETSRIQSLAHAGQVVVSESTRTAIGQAIQVGPKFEAILKGLEGHRVLYPVVGIADNR